MVVPLLLLEIDCRWPEDELEKALPRLQKESRERAERYLCQRSRRTLIASHFQRDRLLEHLGEDPSGLERSDKGRPFLPGSDLQFNLSHSHERAVLAVARSSHLHLRLGVDVEWVDRRTDLEGLSKRFFTPREHRWVGGHRERFFHIWTRKEALLKSNGVGLRVELDSFEVLGARVDSEICGQPLELFTSPREARYMVSWAVPPGSTTAAWLADTDPHWLERARELLKE